MLAEFLLERRRFVGSYNCLFLFVILLVKNIMMDVNIEFKKYHSYEDITYC